MKEKGSRQQWHFYDQGLFNFLAQQATVQEATSFAQVLNQELDLDLFELGFCVVITPFSFFESIGIASIENIHSELFSQIVLEKEGSAKLISTVKNKTLGYLKNHTKLSRGTLTEAARRQLTYAKNHVFLEVIKHCYDKPIEWLQGANEDDKNWYDFAIEVLAVEFTFQFPYYKALASAFPCTDMRRAVTQQIYHDFIHIAIKASRANPNVSFFRALNRARREFANWGDADARSKKNKFIDPYIGYQRNNEDLLDSDLIHLSIFGYFFEGRRLPVMIYTAEEPEPIEERIKYAFDILNWAGTHMKDELPKCYGKIFCFKGVCLSKVIDVSSLDSSLIFSTPSKQSSD